MTRILSWHSSRLLSFVFLTVMVLIASTMVHVTQASPLPVVIVTRDHNPVQDTASTAAAAMELEKRRGSGFGDGYVGGFDSSHGSSGSATPSI